MKGYQTSCFVCVCNRRGGGAEGERELPGAISIKPWPRSAAEEPAVARPLLITRRPQLLETQRCVISERRCAFPDELEKGFFFKKSSGKPLGWSGWA